MYYCICTCTTSTYSRFYCEHMDVKQEMIYSVSNAQASRRPHTGHIVLPQHWFIFGDKIKISFVRWVGVRWWHTSFIHGWRKRSHSVSAYTHLTHHHHIGTGYAVSVGTHILSVHRYTKNSYTDKDIMSLVFFFFFFAVDVMTCDIKFNDTITIALVGSEVIRPYAAQYAVLQSISYNIKRSDPAKVSESSRYELPLVCWGSSALYRKSTAHFTKYVSSKETICRQVRCTLILSIYRWIAGSHKYSTQSCRVLDKVKALYDIQFNEVKRDKRYFWLKGIRKWSTLQLKWKTETGCDGGCECCFVEVGAS